MIDYTLAKELKVAGFPMTECDWLSSRYYNLEGEYGYCATTQTAIIVDGETGYDIPTLSELIEACGEDFFSLAYPGKNLWEAHESPMGLYTQGKTPEEAVAKLWLALNKPVDNQ